MLPSSASTALVTGSNSPWSLIIATIAKNTTSRAVNGSASWKAWPIWCSSTTPEKVVARMMTDRPISPTAARWNMRPMTSQIATTAWAAIFSLSRVDSLADS